jgi:hypothetical protein
MRLCDLRRKLDPGQAAADYYETGSVRHLVELPGCSTDRFDVRQPVRVLACTGHRSEIDDATECDHERVVVQRFSPGQEYGMLVRIDVFDVRDLEVGPRPIQRVCDRQLRVLLASCQLVPSHPLVARRVACD